ncbi:MAG: transporter, family, tetracycline resistance protein [Gaiellaceae bacterium]|jgi:MFS family permease|nr:transporter, family, tetracycline resistance protein [Gaiellaceae bacterium]
METTAASEALVDLPGVRRRVFWALGLGAFGLAFSLTTTAAYLPPLLHRFTSSGGLIGAVLGAEGIFALTLSPVIGPWSDSFHTPLGRRRPFMLVAVFPIGFCLLLMPFMPNLWTTVVIVMSFFFAYYLFETPYRGLYPDVLPAETFGRSQSVQHIQRGIAIGIALVGGGLLFKLWRPAPFVLAAILTTTACGLTILLVREDGGHGRVFEGFVAYIKRSWHIFWADGDVRRFLLANSAWEGTFAAARTFVVLYIIDGLHQSKVMSSAVLGAVATGYVIAAIMAGRLGDRFGLARVIFVASWIYGAGFLVGGLAQRWHDWYFPLIVLVSIAGGTVMTLAWGLLYKIVPVEHRGAVSGLATTTKGIGLLIGAPVAGLAIDLAKPYLQATSGYQVLWPICGLPILAAIPLLVRLMEIEPRAKADTPAV